MPGAGHISSMIEAMRAGLQGACDPPRLPDSRAPGLPGTRQAAQLPLLHPGCLNLRQTAGPAQVRGC